VVVFSGRLEIRKGVHVLVQAMHRVWDAHPQAQLVLIGRDSFWKKGLMSAELRRLAGPRSDRLHMLGDQPQTRLFPALAAADVVALPSLWEAFGIAALEAMALGRPTVVTAAGGYPEFVRPDRDGLLVAPADPSALAEALTALLGDASLRERLGASAAARAEEFAAPVIADRYVACFEDIAGRA
jgi:glycosyltransferase involved in cell wall biosynthesis